MPKYNFISENIFTVTGFLTERQCDAYIQLAETRGFEDAPINTALGAQIRKDVRNNQRVILDDQDLANHLWPRIEGFVPRFLGGRSARGVNERFRFYRYDVGQQFDWHYDGYFERDHGNGERSQLTFMIYLNDNFVGGETAFNDLSIAPEKGMALFFVHQIRHKGQPVIDGRKYVLRTDVMYSPFNSAVL